MPLTPNPTFKDLELRISILEEESAKQKETEKELREQNRLLEAVLDGIQDIIGIQNPDHTMIRYNRAGYRMLGLSHGDVEGKPCYTLIGRNKPCPACATVLALQSRKIESVDVYFPELDRYFNCRSNPILDETGNVRIIIEQLHDQTNQKKSEAAHRESEENFRILTEETPLGISLMNAEQKFEYFNPRFTEILGYTLKDIQTKDDWFEKIYSDPQYRENIRAFWHHHFIENPVVGRIAEGIVDAKSKDGTDKSLSLRAVFLSNGKYLQTYTDITEHKKAKEALSDSEQKFSALFSVMKEMVVLHELIFDGHGKAVNYRILNCNRAFTEITGISRGGAIGKLATDVYGTEAPPYWDVYSVVALTGEPYEFTTYYEPLKKYFQISVVSPRINTFATLATDITDRKRAEDALRKSEAKYRRLLASLMDGFVSVNLQGAIQEFNDTFRNMVGYSANELLKLRYQDITPVNWHAFEQEIIDKQTTLQDYTDVYEKEYRHKDGTVFPVELRTYVMRNEINQPIGYWAIVRDITERNKARKALQNRENMLNRIIEILPVGLWIADKEGNLLRSNVAGREIWGAEPLVGLQDYGVFKARRLPSGEEIMPDDWALTKTIKEGISVLDELLEIDAFDGKKKTIINYTAPVIDDKGQIEGAIVVNHDISELKHMQIKHMEMQERLHRAEKMEAIGTLAGGIAHDFNNILASILGYTELSILQDNDKTLCNQYLNKILVACDRAKNLVNQILLFSQQREGERKPIDIRMIVKEVLKLLMATIPSTIKITQNISSNRLLIEGDPTHIHQIIMNLCTNAAHAMRDHGGELLVSMTLLPLSEEMILKDSVLRPGEYVHLQVADSGCGIQPSIIDKIFDPFFSTKKQGEGTGLGLSVVYGIVKSYDGIINVQSKIGQGTVFDVYLPAIADLNHAEDPSINRVPEKGTGRILVVDDEKELAIIISKYLESIGYKVVTATRSLAALEIVREDSRQFDLVITDMTMPVMTGLRLSKEILSVRPDIPIILCTGYSELITETEAKKNGIKEFVLKPVRLNELSRLVKKILNQS